MHKEILSRLAEIEASENIQIIFACESGSRAWGFPSQNSDYDVRFIYLHTLEWYLSIDEKPDVIETPIQEQLDIQGWDLKKALKLIRKTNPPLLEWLGSPIVYLEKPLIINQMRQIAKDYYHPSACMYHYIHMARGNFRDYLLGDTVWVKKYFYVLRPLLAANWIEKDMGIVPTDFNILVERLVVNPDLKATIQKLLVSKLSGDELDKGPRVPILSDYIYSELERWEHLEIPARSNRMHGDRLDEFFRISLAEAWSRS
jgi:uncharacterized protein